MPAKLTTTQFIDRSKALHCDFYDYSLVEYKNNHTKVLIICSDHGSFEQLPLNHLKGIGCFFCGLAKQKQTMLNRYGVEYPLRSAEIRKNMAKTNLERYGVKNPMQSKEIITKVKQTNLSRYGVEYPQQSKEIRAKAKKTNLKKYGAENPFASKEIQERIKRTNLKRYGVEFRFASKEIQEKIRQTNLERYGVEYSNQKHLSPFCLEKINDFVWLYEEYVIKKRTVRDIADELKIDNSSLSIHLKKFGIVIKNFRSHSFKALQWLESIMEKEGIFIQHAQNIGEYNIPKTRLHVDGYCKETNTIYEFYGDIFHGNPDIFAPNEKCHPFNNEITASELYYNTLQREKIIRELRYNLVTIWESELVGAKV